MRRSLAIAAGFVIVAAVVVLMWRHVDERTPAVDSVEPAAAPTASAASPKLAALGTRVGPSEAPTSPASSASADVDVEPPRYRGPLHVHGRVIAPDGTAFGVETRVHLVAVRGELSHGTILGSWPVQSSGAFGFRLTVEAGVSLVRVVASVPGFVTATADATPSPDGDVAVDVRLADLLAKGGWTSKARVVDSKGAPLAGLPVFVEAAGDEGTISIARLDPSVVIGGGEYGVAVGLRGSAITDAEGRFEIRGLRCGGCSKARSASTSWYILENRVNQQLIRGSNGDLVTLTAWPAGMIDLDVVEAGTLAPVGAFTVSVATALGTSISAEGAKGRIHVVFPRPPNDFGTTLDVSVRAEGFAPTTLEVAATSPKATVALRPSTPADRGAVRARIARAPPTSLTQILQRRPVHLSLRRAGHPSVAWREGARAFGTEFLFNDAPPGAWEFEIDPPDEAAVLRMRGTLVVVADRVVEIGWDVPKLGSFAIEGEALDDVGETTVVVRTAGRAAVEWSIRGYPGLLPAGSWDLEVVDETGKVRGRRDGVTIAENTRTTINLDDGSVRVVDAP